MNGLYTPLLERGGASKHLRIGKILQNHPRVSGQEKPVIFPVMLRRWNKLFNSFPPEH